jgi:hypothetical protein
MAWGAAAAPSCRTVGDSLVLVILPIGAIRRTRRPQAGALLTVILARLKTGALGGRPSLPCGSAARGHADRLIGVALARPADAGQGLRAVPDRDDQRRFWLVSKVIKG